MQHGSINESFIDVYQITGEEKYLKWAKDSTMRILGSLSEGKGYIGGLAY